jgi:hypothetical protein
MFQLKYKKNHHQAQLQYQLKAIMCFKPFLMFTYIYIYIYIYKTEIPLLCVSSPLQDVSLKVIKITSYSKQSKFKSETVMGSKYTTKCYTICN